MKILGSRDGAPGHRLTGFDRVDKEREEESARVCHLVLQHAVTMIEAVIYAVTVT